MSSTTVFPGEAEGRGVIRPEIPHRVTGRFRRTKTLLNAVMLGAFFVTPWLRWHRGEGLPDQAVLFDLPGRRMLFFGLELWPQDLPIALGVMIGAAMALFCATTLAGRVWCGFACPQTVWSDLFFSVDRLLARVTGRGKGRKAVRNAAWIAIALLTGFGCTAYFNDVMHLPGALLSGTAPAAAYLSILVLTGTTWLLAAYARERVCLHMCPWPRFQAALLDRQSLVVTYQAWRGEPRGRKRLTLRPELLGRASVVSDAGMEQRGDCVDCTRCVTVCPTGVDIRKGLQMGCIGCGLCVDACNDVMAKLDRPNGLIRFDNDMAAERRSFDAGDVVWFRPKALLFGLAALLAFGFAAWGAFTIQPVAGHADAQRNPPFVRLSDGSLRNDYALRLSHRLPALVDARLHVEGLGQASLRLGRQSGNGAEELALSFGAGRSLEERVLLTLPARSAPHGRQPFDFVLTDGQGRELLRLESYFWGPGH